MPCRCRCRCRFNAVHLALGIILFQFLAIVTVGFAIADTQWYEIDDAQYYRLALNPGGAYAATHGLFPKPLGTKQMHLDRLTAALLIIGILVSIASSLVAILFYMRYLGICCTKMRASDATLFNVLLGLTWMTTFIWGTAVIIFWIMMPNRIPAKLDSEVSVTQAVGRGFYLAFGAAFVSFMSIPFAVSLELVLQKIDFY